MTGYLFWFFLTLAAVMVLTGSVTALVMVVSAYMSERWYSSSHCSSGETRRGPGTVQK